LLACALLALACIESSRPALDPAPREPQVEQSTAAPDSALVHAALAGDARALAYEAQRELDAEPDSKPAPAPIIRAALGSAEPPARIFGLVLDSRSEPIRGARVAIASLEGDWRAGRLVPEIELEGVRVQGYITSTDAAGQFSIEAPIPTSAGIEVRVEDGPARAISQRRFGGAPESEPFVAGDNDLGVCVLHDAAHVQGRVLAASGEAIEGARVLCRSSSWQIDGRTQSGADGSFGLGPVVLGEHTLSAWAADFEPTERVLVIDHQARPVNLELVLQPIASGPTRKLVKGIVVDGAARPVPDCALLAYSGSGCVVYTWEITSDGHGRFEVEFADPREGWIGLDRDAADWIGREHAERGTLDEEVRLVLDRPSHVDLRVLDACTGVPIARSWLELCREGGSQGHRTAPISFRAAPDGLTRIRIDPQAPWIRCAAPGYAPYEGPIALDAADPTRGTVRLKRGGEVRGRVLGAAYPIVRLVGLSFPTSSSSLQDEDESWSLAGSFPSSFLGRMHTRVAAADGSFAFEDLATGSYELTIYPSPIELQTMRRFDLRAGELLDLGALPIQDPEDVHSGSKSR
jgi:protocatechuate 3,4-dioxygenase beta subunit